VSGINDLPKKALVEISVSQDTHGHFKLQILFLLIPAGKDIIPVGSLSLITLFFHSLAEWM
jgi:hypothetical protein